MCVCVAFICESICIHIHTLASIHYIWQCYLLLSHWICTYAPRICPTYVTHYTSYGYTYYPLSSQLSLHYCYFLDYYSYYVTRRNPTILFMTYVHMGIYERACVYIMCIRMRIIGLYISLSMLYLVCIDPQWKISISFVYPHSPPLLLPTPFPISLS